MVLLFYLKGRVNMKEKRMMVSKSVALTQAMQGMKLTEYRIFLYALSKVNPFNVEKAKEEVYISLRDFRDMFPTKNRGIRNITKAIEEAENRSVTLQTGEVLKVWKAISFDGDYIKTQFSDEILPHITDLKGAYVKFPIEDIRWHTSVPAIRVYEILTQWAKKGEKVYPISQLQSILGVHYKSGKTFYKALCRACKAVAYQGRYDFKAVRIYKHGKLESIKFFEVKTFDIIGERYPTKRAKAWANGEYAHNSREREGKVDVFTIPVEPTIAVKEVVAKAGEWIDEKVITPVAETVQKVADALPPVTSEPVMAAATPVPAPTPAVAAPAKSEPVATSAPAPTSTSSDIPAYVPDTYRKAFTSKEIAKIINVFDVRGVFEYLRGDVLKQAWGIFCASKDEVKTPANYIAGTVRNLLTKMGVDMPNIFAANSNNTNTTVSTAATVSKYPRKIEWQDSTGIKVKRKGFFLDYEPNFDTDVFEYDAPSTCSTEPEQERYSKEAKRREKIKVADMVSQIPLDLYWRLDDTQIDEICDYYENKDASLEEMKTELQKIYEAMKIRNIPSSVIDKEKIFIKLSEAMQDHAAPCVAPEQPDNYASFANQY